MKSLFITVTLIFLLLFGAIILADAAVLQPEMIKVALHKGVESVKIDGNGLLATDGEGDPLRLGAPFQARRSKDGVAVNGKSVKSLIVTAPAFVLVNGKGYRGSVTITPADRGGLIVVNELPLEDYLVGLINCEISSQWPIEAVKAQAVIARSYAIYQREARGKAPFHLESSVMDQVYEGCDIEDSRAARGVKETAGEVLTFGGNVIQAFYHSNCGGHTEAAENVWGATLPYLKGSDCNYCLAANPYRWDQSIPLKKLESLLKVGGYQVAGLREIKGGSRNRSGRLNEVILSTSRGRVTVPAVKFRKAVGFGVIKSTNFEVSVKGDSAIFSGIGNGHGVGLCQWGAKQRASDGFDYREILFNYYPGTKIERLYSD